MSMDEKPTEGRAEELTVENLTNSLAQIEIWIKAVRKALETMDPKQTLSLSAAAKKTWTGKFAPIRTTRECPPPE